MRKFLFKIALFASAIIVNSCITPFEPAGVADIDNMVVIEGDIIQNDTTKVTISRSLAIKDLNKVNYITKAIVWIESEKGTMYTGKEVLKSGKTQYLVNTIGIDKTLKYKVMVQLSTGRRYASDLVPVLISPPIDSIGFNKNKGGESVTFYVNTHDSNNMTKYYKWSYKEDWEFHTVFMSLFLFNPLNNKVTEITPDKNRYYCWNSSTSSSVLVATTSHLEQDKVYQKSLATIAQTDNRISILYSMYLTQMAISRDAYLYWENIRKNSDNIGGIFSPQPSEIGGNIHCITDPSERVLGYISGGLVARKRIFAFAENIGIYVEPNNCESVVVDALNLIPFETLYQTGYDVVDYGISAEGEVSLWSLKRCVDCRTQGTKLKPSFWPNEHI